ncbi:MAG: alpha-2-macroglobulin family protein, partial [Methanosarcinales archaeon]
LNSPNSEVRLEVHRNHQFMYSDTISLNEYGNALYKVRDLEEGEYKVVAKIAEKRSEVEFSVAEYTLSPLQAVCEKFVIEENLIKADLQVTVLNQPFTGELEVGLFCAFCDAVVTTGKCRVENGISKDFKISISGHTGPFTLQLSTSDGKTASVFLQGTRTEEKEEIMINPLGRKVMASLAPRKDSNPIKEMYYRTTGTTNTPFIIENAIADLVTIKSTTSFNKVTIVKYVPSTDETEIIEKENVENGDIIGIENNAPYSLLLIGGLKKNAYEAYSMIFKPDELQVTLEVPDSALPSSEIEVNIKTNKKANCILLCYDQRLEHVDLNKNLAKQVFNNMKTNLEVLGKGFIREVLASKQKREEEKRKRSAKRMIGMRARRLYFAELAEKPKLAVGPPVDYPLSDFVQGRLDLEFGSRPPVDYPISDGYKEITIATQPEQLRFEFPDLIFCEMFEVEGKVTKTVQLGDQIGTWKVQLYAFSGFDYVESSKTTVATKDTFVEVDTPAFIAQGDSCFVDIIYNSPKDADNLLVVEGIMPMEKRISGSGVERIEINKSGELRVKLIAPYFTDEVVKYVGMPCVEKITTSQLYLMEAGEELKDFKSAVIYQDWSALIEDTVDSLIQYPFGCAEQTSSKLCGLGIVYKGIKSGAIDRDIKEVEKLIKSGLNRMKEFYKNGMFSLWEEGNPEVRVTSMVLRNLIPFSELDFTDASEMIQTSADTLLESGVKDTRLVSINKKFYNGIDCVEDAVSVYLGDFSKKEKEKALKYIIKNANSENGIVYWNSDKAWTKLETTLEALKALYIAKEQELFKKGFAH